MRSKKRARPSHSRLGAVVALLLAAWAAGAVHPRPQRRSDRARRRRRRAYADSAPGRRRRESRSTSARSSRSPSVSTGTRSRTTSAGYFNCVNDNGGINGRPINYIVHVDPINPELVAAFAKKLIEEEKVVGIVGNIDVMDCAVNAQYYAQKKFYVIGDGVHDLCYGGTPNHIPINMGPAYSTLGAAQYLVRKGARGRSSRSRRPASTPREPGTSPRSRSPSRMA